MQTEGSPSYERIFRLFRDGYKLENIMSGWHVSEVALADLVIEGYRAGEVVNPSWLAPQGLAERIYEALDRDPSLTPTQLSGQFKGRVSPALIKALRVVRGEGRGLDTHIYGETSFFNKLHDDIAGAKKEVLVVTPQIKSQHWRKYLDGFRHVMAGGGQVAFFAHHVSDLIVDSIKSQEIILLEKITNANLVVIDRQVLWEGSMNFLLPPAGEEHVRRTKSRLQCDEILDIHDLYL